MTRRGNAQAAAGQGFLHILVAKLVRAPLWLLLSSLLARLLAPDSLGAWAMIVAAAMFFNQTFFHWTQAITQKYGRREWVAAATVRETLALRMPWLAIGVAGIVLSLALQPADWATRVYGLEAGMAWYILPVAIAYLLMAETQNLQQAKERFVILAWSSVVADSLLVGAILLCLWLGVSGERVFPLLAFAPLLVWTLWVWREYAASSPGLVQPSRARFIEASRFAFPLIPAALVGYGSEWCDYFLIRHFYDEYQVGIFHPAYQYLLILIGLPTALASVLLPRLVVLAEHGNAALKGLIADQLPKYVVLWGLAALAISALLPDLARLLLGGDFAASAMLVQVMLVALPGAVVQHVCSVACFVQGRLGVATIGMFCLKSAVNLAVSYALLPVLGVQGSALGVAVSYVVLQWAFLFDQSKRLAIGGDWRFLLLGLSQAAGVLLALVNGMPWRIVVALVSMLALVYVCRRTYLFSAPEIEAVLAGSPPVFAKMLVRCLCRPNLMKSDAA